MHPNGSDKPKRKPRVYKNPSLVHVTIRIPVEVDKWFRASASSHTRAMRDALVEYVAGKKNE
jgi:hypothetical protein